MKRTVEKTVHASLIITGILFFTSANVQAQDAFTVEDVKVINVGDGRLLFRESKDEKPLNGQHRIIDGYRSEYMLAEFENGFYNGAFQFFKSNKLVEKGDYKEGLREGVWTEYQNDGKTVKSEKTYAGGILNGVYKTYYADGKIESEKTFTDGNLNGIFKTYFNDGKIESEKGYKNGVEHGKERRYNWENHDKLVVDANFIDGKADGKQVRIVSSNRCDYTRTEHYKNGLRNGEYSEILENGDVLEKGTYKDGKKDGVWQTNNCEGKPKSAITYKNDLKNGESKTYYTDGSVEKTVNYADDKKNGWSKEYDYNTGNLKSEHHYKNNKKDGDYKLYDRDEKYMKEEGRYENDSQVYYKTYSSDGKVLTIKERNAKGNWESK